MININLTPAQQARVQLYEHTAAIIVFNAVLAALILIGQNSGIPINWNTLIIVALAQGSLAGIDSLATYYKAHGQAQAAAVLSSVEKQEPALLSKESPEAAKLQAQVAPMEQSLAPALDAAFQPVNVQLDGKTLAQTVSFNASRAISPPVQAVQSAPEPIIQDNPAMNGPLETVNTIPNLSIVKANLPT